VRTKHHAPQTNGVVERFYGSPKYENLYRLEVANGQALAEELDLYRALFNEIRPHAHLDFRTPPQASLVTPGSKLSEAESVQET